MFPTHLRKHKKTISVLAINNTSNFIRLASVANLIQTENVKVSILGTLMSDNITFPAGSYTDLDGREITYQKIGLDAVGVVITQRNNIVKTRISGRNGTIKEYVNRDDYRIRCEAILSKPTILPDLINDNLNIISKNKTAEKDFYPTDEAVDILRRIASSNVEVPIVSTLINETFEINDVVFEDISYNYVPGSEDVIVNFTLLSDEGIDLNQFKEVDDATQAQLIQFGVFQTTA